MQHKVNIGLVALTILLSNNFLLAGEFQKYNFLLVGKTGAGKSSLINLFAQIIEGYDYHDDSRELQIAIVNGAHKYTSGSNTKMIALQNKTSNKSQTSEIRTYQVYNNNITYNFIDTPGFFDTDESKRDKYRENLIQFLATVEIHAIILAWPTTEIRDNQFFKDYIAELKNIFPGNIINNISIFETFFDGQQSNIVSLVDSIFPELVAQNRIYSVNSSCQIPSRFVANSFFSSFFWDLAQEQVNSFLDDISQVAPIQSSSFKEFRNLQLELVNSNLDLERLNGEKEELDRLLAELTHVKNDLENKILSTVDYSETVVIKVQIPCVKNRYRDSICADKTHDLPTWERKHSNWIGQKWWRPVCNSCGEERPFDWGSHIKTYREEEKIERVENAGKKKLHEEYNSSLAETTQEICTTSENIQALVSKIEKLAIQANDLGIKIKEMNF